MSERDYRILTGTAGWKHPEWGNEVFYPEDLPEDWYLSFYSNEFPIVLVPDKQWQDDAAIEYLLNEIDEQATAGFQCVFECHWAVENNLTERAWQLAPIEDNVAGLLVQVNSDAIESQQFRDDIASLTKKFKVCLEVIDNKNGLSISKVNVFCEKYAVSLCWQGEGEVVVPVDSTFWLARCNSELDKKACLQQLKTIIAEQFKRESLTREHVIIVDGRPPKVEAVRNAMVMMELM